MTVKDSEPDDAPGPEDQRRARGPHESRCRKRKAQGREEVRKSWKKQRSSQ